MANNTYNSLPNIILLAALSTSVVSLSYTYESIIPLTNHQYSFQNDLTNWKDFALYQSSDYQQLGTNNENLQAIIEFSKAVINNSKDIDSEYVNIVNENFWDLI